MWGEDDEGSAILFFLPKKMEDDGRVEIEMAPVSHDDEEPQEMERAWNKNSEILLTSWAEYYKRLAVTHRRKEKGFKTVHILLLVATMILSYVSGASGLATDLDAVRDAQSYILLVVGVLSTLLKLGKLEKRSLLHKNLHLSYTTFVNKIEVQLSLPPSRRTPYLPFVEKMERERKRLVKSTIK